MKRTSILLILGVLSLVLVGGYTGYLLWQNSVVDADMKRVEKILSDYESELLQYKDQAVMEAISAKRALSEIDMEMIEWSDVIKRVRQAVPKRQGDFIVNVLSYSGSSSSEISMNVKTDPESEDPYFDVADLIEAFDENKYFTDSFVPSISTGTDDEGREVLTFLINANYIEAGVSEKAPVGETEELVEEEIIGEEIIEESSEEIDESLEEAAEEEAPVMR
ncbi:hypothetical protein GF366_01890 [Candidatus Peregrinibacteria bacterium]|nr:hypothetical protein [Candidatus Peregrinibacteria bacterium]